VARARRCAHRPLALFLSLTSVVSAVVEGAGVEASLRSQHDKLRGNAQYLQVLYWRFAGALLVLQETAGAGTITLFLYWSKSANTDAGSAARGGGGGARRGPYALYLLYSYQSTNTDTLRSCCSARMRRRRTTWTGDRRCAASRAGIFCTSKASRLSSKLDWREEVRSLARRYFLY
jgi:hypothetical protein